MNARLADPGHKIRAGSNLPLVDQRDRFYEDGTNGLAPGSTKPPLPPVVVPLAADAVTEALRRAILEGDLRPGQRLKEEDLARDMKVSRTPIRRALVALEAERLVESSPRRGARVVSYDPDEFDDMFSIRVLLEGHAAGLAAARATDADVEALRASCDRLESWSLPDDVLELVEENRRFHAAIVDLAGSSRLTEMVREVAVVPLMYRAYSWFTEDEMKIAARQHRNIVDQVAAHDSEAAAAAMREHISLGRGVIATHLRAGGAEPSG